MLYHSGAGRRQAGFSLIEVVLAIIIIGGALVGILSVSSFTTQHSGDPVVQAQARMIAESYLEEILLKRFVDPDTDSVCPESLAGRAAYDNICDYDGLNDTGARDQLGNPIAELGDYNISVEVQGDETVELHNIDNIGAVRLLRVDVTVTGPLETMISLSGYRTNYNCYSAADDGCRPL